MLQWTMSTQKFINRFQSTYNAFLIEQEKQMIDEKS